MTSIHFTLDGSPVEVTPAAGDKLLDLLREHLGVTTVKNGCGTGACGACTVLVEGKVRRACTMRPERVEGCTVVTAAGLPAPQREMLAACFAHGGAVQCGFCTPGMLVAGVGLLLSDADPDDAAIRKALRGNLCRCTGYDALVDAVREAARRLREGAPPPAPPRGGAVGAPACREGDLRRAAGTHPFVDDVRVPGMLFGAVVLAGVARGRLHSLDPAPALAVHGVERVVTAAHVPGRRLSGMIHEDWPIYVAAGEQTRYVGDVLALVVATTRAAARAGATALEPEIEPLPPLTHPDQALAPDAPALHPDGNLLSHTVVRRGDLAAARDASVYRAEDTFSLPVVDHAFLEPESSLALPAGYDGPLPAPFPADCRGTLTVLSGSQGTFSDRRQIASLLGLPEDEVRVVLVPPGGAFGGKEDLSVQHHAALAAQLCGRPVNVTFTRAESILVHPKRHAMTVHTSIGCVADGTLTYCTADIVSDTGAYASLGAEVTERAVVHATGPYRFDAVELVGRAVYTNNPPAGAMRGFGVPQVAFAIEALVDRLADACGMDRLDFRVHNALRPGWPFSTGQILEDDVQFVATLEAIRPAYEAALAAGETIGLAGSIKNVGIGVGVPDIGRVRLEVRGGRVVVYSGAACMGQGIEPVLRNVVCGVTGIGEADVDVVLGDTGCTPDAGVTTASRQTYLTGTACRIASGELAAAARVAGSLAALEGQAFPAEFGPPTDSVDSGADPPRSHVAFGFATQLVVLGDDGDIVRIVTALDAGTVVNPLGVRGQVAGGTVMALGYALTEDLGLEGGIPAHTSMARLGLPRTTDVPRLEILLLPGLPPGTGASGSSLGAKGIGEVTAIPTAPAVAAAYRHRTGLPLLALPLPREVRR